MQCPGQDRRYWKEDAVFEVPCPECGAPVELFKDEPMRRCPRCDHKFQNPGMDFGCAQWCAMAEQCLGFAPERGEATGDRGGALAGRLIQLLAEALSAEPARMARALKTFHHAKQLVGDVGGDPRIVIAAALVLELSGRTAPEDAAAERLEKVEQVLREAGADQETIRSVCEIVGCCTAGRDLESLEFRVVRDASTLASLPTRYAPEERAQLEEVIAHQLVTDAARKKARSWCEAVAAGTRNVDSEKQPPAGE